LSVDITMKIHCFSLWDEQINQSNEVLLPILNYYKYIEEKCFIQ
jgi:hypothetical protein